MCIGKAAYAFLEYIIKLLLSYCVANFLILGEKFSVRPACVSDSLVKYVTQSLDVVIFSKNSLSVV
jgi:hypothetical protein